ncbi:hypothetical protein [Winogradskya consettensis]|uniref:hypothetical protein n=1 Tax=Winogradskya consettensis TaxID=113560 RepID=UPI001BB3DBAD|nr:hypothetical protein [Actinoplanes consettensis]
MDDVRWGRMRHAYGSAAAVPGLLRGLADGDPAVRAAALDGMYGAVHHQGDVYPCTRAAIPFLLRIAGDVGRPGRAEVVALVASIGAHDAAMGALPLWPALLTDPDPWVRAESATLIAEPAVLRGRFPDEPEAFVRASLVAAVARLARHGVGADTAQEWLSDVLEDDEPRVRMAALAGMAPAVDVRLARDLLVGGYRGDATAEFETVVRTVSEALEDRVAERVTLLTGLLREAEPRARLDAMGPAADLVQRWRGSYDELIGLVGDQLSDGRPLLRNRALGLLRRLGEGAGPAADGVHVALIGTDRRVAESPDAEESVVWIRRWTSGEPAVGVALACLAGTGDERALAMLEWVLRNDELARDVGQFLGPFGERARHLAPVVLGRLDELRGKNRRELLHGLARIDPAAAIPLILVEPMREDTLRVLASIGSPAAEALPMVRGALTSADPATAMAAAGAAHALGGDPAETEAVYDRYLGDPVWQGRATEGLGELGEHAAGSAEKLRGLLARWDDLGAARALWLVAGDASGLDVLERTWQVNRRARPYVAETWALMGTGAASARPLVEVEVAARRRHNADPTVVGADDIRRDEQLLRALRGWSDANGHG